MTTSRLLAIIAYHGFLVKVFRYSFFFGHHTEVFQSPKKESANGGSQFSVTTNFG